MRRISTRLSRVSGETFRWPPMRTGRSYSSMKESSRTSMPLSPLRSPFHVASTSPAIDVVAARLVTTTFGKFPFKVEGVVTVSALLGVELGLELGGRVGVLGLELLDVGDGVTHGLEAGEILVGDLHAVLVLGLHGDLDHRQRVDVQVIDERLLDRHLGGLDAGHLFDDLAELFDDLFLGQSGHLVAPFLFFRWSDVNRRSDYFFG